MTMTVPSAAPATTNDSPQQASQQGQRPARRAVKGALAANYVDQFDIFVPVIALAPVTATLFGAENLATSAGLVFVATLIGRPLGSLLFGPWADRLGRTRISVITLAGIAATTIGIAVVPPHTSWGVWTLYTVIAMRFLGGIFLGGQYSAAIPLAMEWTPPRLRGAVSGGIMAMSPTANATIAALTLTLLTILPKGAYAAWGWRVPFILSATLALVMMIYYLRSVVDAAPAAFPATLPDDAPTTPSARPAPAVRATDRRALVDVTVGAHRQVFVQVFTLMSGLWLLTNMAIPVVTQQLSARAELSSVDVTLIMMCGTAASAVTMLAAGHASTLMGRRRFFLTAAALITVIAPATYLTIGRVESVGALITCVVVLQVFTVSVYGPIGAYLSERFPPHVRSTGYGVGYSVSIILPALYPYYLPTVQGWVGEQQAVAGFLALAAALIAWGSVSAPRGDGASQPLPRQPQ